MKKSWPQPNPNPHAKAVQARSRLSLPSPRRTGRQKSRLDGLPAHQRRALDDYLLVRELPYAATAARMWERFGVQTSSASLSAYYYRRLRPKPSRPPVRPLLELVIEPLPKGRFRVAILQRQRGTNLRVLDARQTHKARR